MNYEEILTLLQNNDCEVTFTKVDGSVRIMPCTLRAEAVPAKLTESKRTKAKNESVINAWCLDKLEWRSFRVANVTDIKVL
jgi:WYL_2, Sm-like SH3 beta-barrel fold